MLYDENVLRKVSARFVHHVLTNEQKKNGVILLSMLVSNDPKGISN